MSDSSTGSLPFTVSRVYDYSPTFGILIAAVAVFGLETAIILLQYFRSRFAVLLWNALFTASECGGYIAFAILIKSPTLNAYLAELIILILAPNIITFVDYTILSYILPRAGFSDDSYLKRNPRVVPIIFLTSDFLCLILQGIGGSQLSAAHNADGSINETKFQNGKDLTLAGITAQLFFQSVFAVLALYVYLTMPDREVRTRLRWTWLYLVLTLALVSIRNIYRIVEFAGGQHSSVDQTEAPYMVLDLLMMALTGLVMIVIDLGNATSLPTDFRTRQVVDAPSDKSNIQYSETNKQDVDAVEMGSSSIPESTNIAINS